MDDEITYTGLKMGEPAASSGTLQEDATDTLNPHCSSVISLVRDVEVVAFYLLSMGLNKMTFKDPVRWLFTQ